MIDQLVFDFDEHCEGGRELLGGKGLGLAEMTALELPVPPGFTVTTEACRRHLARQRAAAGAARERKLPLTWGSSSGGRASASGIPRTRCSFPSARAGRSRCPA